MRIVFRQPCSPSRKVQWRFYCLAASRRCVYAPTFPGCFWKIVLASRATNRRTTINSVRNKLTDESHCAEYIATISDVLRFSHCHLIIRFYSACKWFKSLSDVIMKSCLASEKWNLILHIMYYYFSKEFHIFKYISRKF